MNISAPAVPNYEEAANVASEFITTLDNLPIEVQHLLQEIRIKEQRCQELQLDIARDQSKYIRSVIKQGSTPSTPSSAGGQSRAASPTTNSKAHLPARIAAAYAEVDLLANEKVILAQRIIDLLSRTRARLDSDMVKVRLLQGEPPEEVRASAASYLTAPVHLRSASPYNMKREGSVVGLTPVIQIGESLRNVMGSHGEALPSITLSSGPSYNKKRRLTTNTSIKLPSPAPISLPQPSASHARSRLSRQSHTARAHIQEEEDLDADAEGEEDMGEEDEDLTLYCFCHKQSYGDMIGCDNPECPYQWFHISCVGVKTPLPDKWYCPECLEKNKGIASEKRKGRKK